MKGLLLHVKRNRKGLENKVEKSQKDQLTESLGEKNQTKKGQKKKYL